MRGQLEPMLRVLGSGARIAIRRSPVLASPRTAMTKLCLLPLVNVLYLVALSHRHGFDIGLTAGTQAGALLALSSNAGIDAGERHFATAPFLLLSPLPRLLHRAGALAVSSALAGTAGLVCLTLTSAVAAVSHAIPNGVTAPSLLLIGPAAVAAASLSASCLAYALSAVGLPLRDPHLLPALAAHALSLLTGVIAPPSVLPRPLELLGACLPLTHAVRAVGDLMTAQSAGAWHQLAAELEVGSAWLLGGLAVRALAEHAALRSGGIERL